MQTHTENIACDTLHYYRLWLMFQRDELLVLFRDKYSQSEVCFNRE